MNKKAHLLVNKPGMVSYAIWDPPPFNGSYWSETIEGIISGLKGYNTSHPETEFEVCIALQDSEKIAIKKALGNHSEFVFV